MAKKKPGLNQPCPCGSGRKFKKCCFLLGISSDNDDKKHGPQHQKAANCNSHGQEEQCEACTTISSHDYRFRVGDRVEAAMGEHFVPGTIVALNYQEPGWLGDVPYQIRLDYGGDMNEPHLVYAPFDKDDWVRELRPTARRKRRQRLNTSSRNKTE